VLLAEIFAQADSRRKKARDTLRFGDSGAEEEEGGGEGDFRGIIIADDVEISPTAMKLRRTNRGRFRFR